MGKDKNIEFDENKDRRIKYCQNAPDWAEHARFDLENEPCDDGRTGRICGNRKGEKPCPRMSKCSTGIKRYTSSSVLVLFPIDTYDLFFLCRKRARR